VTDAEVESAFAAGTIIRTHLLRPTWHFVDAADLRWLLALTGPRVHAQCTYAWRRFEVDAAVGRRGAAVVEKALEGGRFRTRAELGAALEAAGLSMADPQRLAHLMLRLELDGVICSGPRRGKRFTYALFEERVPAGAVPSREESLARLATGYFTTRGPATLRDFSWWSGLTVADAGRAASAAELRNEVVGAATYWLGAGAGATPRAAAAPTAHLLPNYDEYFIGFRDRSALGGRVKTKTLPPRTFWANMIVVDGQFVGRWQRKPSPAGVTIELAPLVPLAAAERRAVARAAAALARFLALPATVTTR
jgi:hypothetical protein